MEGNARLMEKRIGRVGGWDCGLEEQDREQSLEDSRKQ